ncbi:MAG: hypothetical protein A3J93_05630 [Candidatus Magasanikbacteria bacterium RIFOXYC2_FULL_42_28]|uniref:Multidrug export protein MepA n=1 Tax=Candidatus Magasanikbacteria bacterium RIFOXYC2_FULL_42_28 TaxID=1798704 RepID=A0A1F6NVX9_9BACT|nr:MAG: hypothetical protein A3J93_05630 [Candidatus Magasanikbacteria bacterium RIFOXYC2_FULL_42_28]
MRPQEKQFLEEPIPRLLWKQSLPAVVGMFVITLYNLADTIFVGRGVGTLALAGVAVSLPLIMIVGAFAQSVGLGFASIISRSLGEKNYRRAQEALGNYVSVSVSVSVPLIILILIWLRPLLVIFGATPDILLFAYEYAWIVMLGTIFFVVASGGNAIVRAFGDAKRAMIGMVIGAVINLILDPIFVFWFHWGIAGVAWATFISWFIGSIYVGWCIFGRGRHLEMKIADFKFKPALLKEGLYIGASAFARQASSSVMMVVLNISLVRYATEIAIAAFGIILRLTMLVFMPIFGVLQGMQPIAGMNYGAGNLARVKEVTRLTIKVSTIISVVAFVIMILFPTQLLGIFSSDPELLSAGKNLMRVFVLAYPLLGFQLVAGAFYQAIGSAGEALFLSTLRQVIFLIPLMLILPLFFGLNGLYASFPVTDILATAITYFVFKRSFSRLHKPMPAEVPKSVEMI